MLVADVANTGSQVTALGILAAVVYWFIRRMDRTDAARDKEINDKDSEIAKLETQLATLREDNTEQHRVKHDALNRVAFLEGRSTLVRRAASECVCGAMTKVLILFEEDR